MKTQKSTIQGLSFWSALLFAAFLASGCERINQSSSVKEEWNGNVYSVSINGKKETFDLDNPADRDRLKYFQEANKEVLQGHQASMQEMESSVKEMENQLFMDMKTLEGDIESMTGQMEEGDFHQ